MTDVTIENPIINSPFEEPKRHFRFDENGITNEIINERRISAYFVPIPDPRKKAIQPILYKTEWTKETLKEHDFINRIRKQVQNWRKGGYVNITNTTRICFITGNLKTASDGYSFVKLRLLKQLFILLKSQSIMGTPGLRKNSSNKMN